MAFLLFFGFIASLAHRSVLLVGDLLGQNWVTTASARIAEALSLPRFGRVFVVSIISDGGTVLVSATILLLLGVFAFPKARVIGCALIASIPCWFLTRDFFCSLGDFPLSTILALQVAYMLNTVVCAAVFMLALRLGVDWGAEGNKSPIVGRIFWGLLIVFVFWVSVDGWAVANDYRQIWLNGTFLDSPAPG